MFIALLFICIAVSTVGLLGRIYIRLFSPQGVTWVLGVMAGEGAIRHECTHYLSAREYWPIMWGWYFNTGNPDPFPCVNIPCLFLDWVMYTMYIHLVIPWLFGRHVPLRYVYYKPDYQGKKPLYHGDSSNLDDYDARHQQWIPVCTSYFQ
jgi:hypothetical protein